MKIAIEKETLKGLQSMNMYWQEISKRESHTEAAKHEFQQLISILSPMDILLIVGEFVSNFEDKK